MHRCPHCATPRPTRPVCGVCGSLLTSAPADPGSLPGLEPTRAPPAVASTDRLVGLLTTEDELGDVRIPIDEEPAPLVCRRCGAPSAGGHFCDRCGFVQRPLGLAERAAGEVDPAVRCLACGSPNPPAARLCAGCGQRLHA